MDEKVERVILQHNVFCVNNEKMKFGVGPMQALLDRIVVGK
jgi:hypothetical protein